jgi:hypothetical protein
MKSSLWIALAMLACAASYEAGKRVETAREESAALEETCPPTVKHIALWYDPALHGMRFTHPNDEPIVSRAVARCQGVDE